ncbi:MAG: hypothetical protein JXJ22_00025 [Bacteroidales bacterium]|nr:hypothetical protein [Bacteroidales bacterium]
MKKLLIIFIGVLSCATLLAQNEVSQNQVQKIDKTKLGTIRSNSRDKNYVIRDNYHNRKNKFTRAAVMKQDQMQMRKKAQIKNRQKMLNRNQIRNQQIRQKMMQERRNRMHGR